MKILPEDYTDEDFVYALDKAREWALAVGVRELFYEQRYLTIGTDHCTTKLVLSAIHSDGRKEDLLATHPYKQPGLLRRKLSERTA